MEWQHARFAVVLVAAITLNGQIVGQNKAGDAEEAPTFSTSTQLVIENVTVADARGNPISGLTANDFTITENGVPQRIRLFDYQNLPAPGSAPVLSPEIGRAHIYDRLPRTQIAGESPGQTIHKDRRLIALYFDFTSMMPNDQDRSLDAAKKFVRTQMTAADAVAIMRYEGSGVEVYQDFTSHRARLLSILETMSVGGGQGFDKHNGHASASDAGTPFGQDDSEFDLFNTDRQLAALQSAAEMLGRLSEKKLLIYFAGGLQLSGSNNQAQLHAAVNSAIRAGVSFWPVDARGLSAEAPMGDTTQGSPGGVGMYSGESAEALISNRQASQDTLYALAADTGGKALLDNNELTKGIVDAERSITSYYILGYYSSNAAPDGKCRRIKVTVINHPSASVGFRQGYFGTKEFSKVTAADKERQLEEALLLPDPITQLSIAMEIDYFQLNWAEYFVPVVAKIPDRELTHEKRGAAERAVIDFIGEIKDEYGITITNVRDKIEVKLDQATAAEWANRPIVYDTGFTLLPGKYVMKFVARDDETGRLGTYQRDFTVPNLNREEKRVAMSSVVLSSQRVDLKDALYNTSTGKTRQESVSPLVARGQKLVPSVSRVFHRGRELYVYLQAYEQEATETRPLVAFVSFYTEEKRVLETQPVESSKPAGNRLKTLDFLFHIPLHALAPGKYNCQVTVLDPSAHKQAFWRSPIIVIP